MFLKGGEKCMNKNEQKERVATPQPERKIGLVRKIGWDYEPATTDEGHFANWIWILGRKHVRPAEEVEINVHANAETENIFKQTTADPVFRALNTIYWHEFRECPWSIGHEGQEQAFDDKFADIAENLWAAKGWVEPLKKLKGPIK